jgi:eukaryotic-like serine/threonine-protein kinase
MTPELYQRAFEIFSAAADLPATQRDARVEAECGGDTELLRTVREMLAADAAPLALTGGDAVRRGVQWLLGEPTMEPGGAGTGNPGAGDGPTVPGAGASSFRMPSRIGPYAITGFIGRGGMGEVFEARQENPSRTVAVKISPLAAASPAALRRFEREVEFLARLTHPGIAQIYDAGIADMGGVSVPYFAMELVRGTPVTEYARTKQLSLRQRVELVATLCDAVQYAHQQGVIHRDLKPDNILIPVDAAAGDAASAGRVPLPRILDFGIARLAQDQQAEQRTMATEAGQPIGTPGFMAPEQIRGETALIDTRCDVYALGVIAYLLLGGRAPHGDAGSSVFELTRATLEADPVPLAVAAGVMVLAAYQREQRQRLEAEAARTEARREAQSQRDIASFLVYDTFGAAAPSRRGTAVKATELIDEAAAAVDARFPDDAVLRGRVRAVIANMLYGTGQFERAEQAARKAVTELRAATGGDQEALCEAMALHGSILSGKASTADQAEAVLRETMQCGDPANPRMIQTRAKAAVALGELLQKTGRHDEARLILRRVIAETVPTGPLEREAAASARLSLAASLQATDVQEGVEELLREAVEITSTGISRNAPVALSSRNSYAALLAGRGRFAEAAPIVLDLVERIKQTYPADHPNAAFVMATAARVLCAAGRTAEGLPMISRAVEIIRLRSDDGNFNVERLAGLAMQLHKEAGDAPGAAKFMELHLRARLLAAKDDERAGVVARLAEYRDLLARIDPAPERVEAGLMGYVKQCRDEIPLINKEGGLQRSPHAARLMANLARALLVQRQRHPKVAAEAGRLLEAARAALAASKNQTDDGVLIEAVAKELAAAGAGNR